MQLRIPPLLPPYAVLVLVIAYAVAALWIGLARQDAIAQLTETTERNAKALHDLESLLNAVTEIESAGRGYAVTSDAMHRQTFELERRRIPALLAELRDKARTDAAELALIESLVPLVSERITITAAGIESKTSVPPGQPPDLAFGKRANAISEAIRTVVSTLETRKQEQLARTRQTLALTMTEARRDLYIKAFVILLLVMSLFLTVRRLRQFIPATSSSPGAAVGIAPDGAQAEAGSGIGTLLRDAVLRARLEAAAAPPESKQREQLLSIIAALDKTQMDHGNLAGESDVLPPGGRRIHEAVAQLAQTYTRPQGLTIRATIDKSIEVADERKAFLIFRSAEWALEATMVRKRTGDVTLHFTASGEALSLRIHALIDSPELPVALAPRESDQADVLRQGVETLGGTFVVAGGPTGFTLNLTMPVAS